MSMTLKDKITAWEPQAVWSEAGDGMWTVPAEKFHDLAARLRAEGFDFLRSLTVCNPTDDTFQVAIIPYTYEYTNFHTFEIGSVVNIEFDIIGKYISRMIQYR